MRGAGRSVERKRASVTPSKQNEGREVWAFKTNKRKPRPYDLIQRNVQGLRRSPAVTSNSATGSHVFCARPPWVSCVVRAAVDGQLLRDAAAAAAPPDPALFFYLLLLSSSLQSRRQGLRTPKVFIQSKPRGDFHQLGERLSSHDVSRPLTHQTFIMATPPAHRGCLCSHPLKCFRSYSVFGLLNDLVIHPFRRMAERT